MQTYPYLTNTSFLRQVDNLRLKQQYVKINVLSFQSEKEIAEITGNLSGGNITIDGSSAMRRTATVSIVVIDNKFTDTDVKKLLTINKKIELLVGFKNVTKEYTNYPILWFPQGVFVITSANITHNQQGISISLTLHDKMALLNGECGGVLPASTVFHEVEDIDENGNIEITNPTIYQIIQEAVNHFGGEQLSKIIISDLDSRIKKVMKWTGSTPLYLYQEQRDGMTRYNSFSTNYQELEERQQQGHGTITEFSYGEDIGYILTDFIYPGELIGNAGATIVSILDQIKNTLGNYEYFYDINGNFVFQEIKNYLNTSYSTFLINNMSMDNYLVDYTNGESVYVFDNSEIVQSYSNSPQFQQIKNDFLVWGKRKTITGQDIPIRYHLAIDTKPPTGNQYKVFFFIDPDDGIEKAKKPFQFPNKSAFPEKGQVGCYYYDMSNGKIYKWNTEANDYDLTPYVIENIVATDWRTELYMMGVANQPFGLESNYYYTELNNEWPKIYDMRNQKFFDKVVQQPSNIDFFLDFIDTSSSISDFNVQNIGRRTTTIVDDSINCIFESQVPDIVIIEEGSIDADEMQRECEAKKQEWVQVRPEVYNMLMNGGVLKSAYEQIKKEVYQYTNYNQQITLTVLPIYYIEPNTRITVNDEQSNISGDYMIKSISLPLDTNGVMNLTCTRALERI